MTRTKPTAAEDAEATEKWLDGLDPSQLEFCEASHVRAIIAANEALAAAEENLRKAVAEARAAGTPGPSSAPRCGRASRPRTSGSGRTSTTNLAATLGGEHHRSGLDLRDRRVGGGGVDGADVQPIPGPHHGRVP